MKDRPLLANCYKVTSPEGKVSYLFGTMHLLYKVPKEIKPLIEKKQIQHTYIERDLIKNEVDLPSIIILDQKISLMSRAKNIPITQLDCLPGNNIQQIRFEASHFTKDDLKAFFTPEIILNEKKDDYLGSFLKKNRYFVKDYDAILERQKHDTQDLGRVDQRNQFWKSTVLKAFQQGDALVAVGIAHIVYINGYIDILQRENFILEPYECTIDVNDEEIKKVRNLFTDSHSRMKIAKELEEHHSTNLKQQLPTLIKQFHEKKLSSMQENELDRILKFILGNNFKNIFFKKTFPFFLITKGIIEYSIDSIIKNKFYSELEITKIELNIQSLFKIKLEPNSPNFIGEQRQAAFMVCLFYPELAKKLYQSFQESSNTYAINIFILCGFNAHVKPASLYEEKIPDKISLSSKIIYPHSYFQPKKDKEDKEISIKIRELAELKISAATTIQTNFRKYLKHKKEAAEEEERMVALEIAAKMKTISLKK